MGEFDESMVRHDYSDLSDIRLHYVEGGEGQLVVLLHGFPEFWFSWRRQIPALIDAGYRVVAPDMRGYNLSDKPPRVSDYKISNLARDVRELIEERGEEEAFVVGHDWGAAVAWDFAARYPQQLRKLTIMNGPHPAGMKRELRTNLSQLQRSWYMFFFQLPWLPERWLRRDDFSMIRKVLSSPGRDEAITPQEIERYVEAMARPGATTATVNYYRAALRHINDFRVSVVEAPTMVVWGMEDAALGPSLATPPEQWVPCCRVERIEGAGHWVQVEAPAEVNAHLLDFLRE